MIKLRNLIYFKFKFFITLNGDWGLGIGDWGLGLIFKGVKYCKRVS